MKKAADYIAVSAFFVIVIMFAAYTLVMGRHGSESEKADSSDIRHNAQTYVSNNFPLSSNWKSLRTTMFVMTEQVPQQQFLFQRRHGEPR